MVSKSPFITICSVSAICGVLTHLYGLHIGGPKNLAAINTMSAAQIRVLLSLPKDWGGNALDDSESIYLSYYSYIGSLTLRLKKN